MSYHINPPLSHYISYQWTTTHPTTEITLTTTESHQPPLSHHVYNRRVTTSYHWATISPTLSHHPSITEPLHLLPMTYNIFYYWAATSTTTEPPHLLWLSHCISYQWATNPTTDPQHLLQLSYCVSNHWATTPPPTELPHLLQMSQYIISYHWATTSPTTEPVHLLLVNTSPTIEQHMPYAYHKAFASPYIWATKSHIVSFTFAPSYWWKRDKYCMVPWRLVPLPLVLVTNRPACFSPWTLGLKNV